MSKPFILLVEDDRMLRSLVAENLENEDYDVMSTGLAEKADQYVSQHQFDAIILDLNLPDGNGSDLCKRWRHRQIKSMILILTAKDTEQDMLEGFSAGADDYIVKPYPLSVLLCRIEALLRRSATKQSTAQPPQLSLPGFTFDLDARQIFSDESDHEIPLTKIEYELLLYMINNQNRAISYDEILENVWGDNIQVVQGAIRNCISSIRKKLDCESPQTKWRIVTLRGVGYRLETV